MKFEKCHHKVVARCCCWC